MAKWEYKNEFVPMLEKTAMYLRQFNEDRKKLQKEENLKAFGQQFGEAVKGVTDITQLSKAMTDWTQKAYAMDIPEAVQTVNQFAQMKEIQLKDQKEKAFATQQTDLILGQLGTTPFAYRGKATPLSDVYADLEKTFANDPVSKYSALQTIMKAGELKTTEDVSFDPQMNKFAITKTTTDNFGNVISTANMPVGIKGEEMWYDTNANQMRDESEGSLSGQAAGDISKILVQKAETEKADYYRKRALEIQLANLSKQDEALKQSGSIVNTKTGIQYFQDKKGNWKDAKGNTANINVLSGDYMLWNQFLSQNPGARKVSMALDNMFSVLIKYKESLDSDTESIVDKIMQKFPEAEASKNVILIRDAMKTIYNDMSPDDKKRYDSFLKDYNKAYGEYFGNQGGSEPGGMESEEGRKANEILRNLGKAKDDSTKAMLERLVYEGI